MTAAVFKVPENAPEALPWASAPPVAMQQLWFSLQRQPWASLVVVPADPETATMDFGRPLYEVGRLAMGDRLRLLDARQVKLSDTAPLILDMTGASSAPRPAGVQWSERVLVLLESVLSHPWGVSIALAADAAVLCVELGRTRMQAARDTISLLGAQRFLGCVTLPPR